MHKLTIHIRKEKLAKETSIEIIESLLDNRDIKNIALKARGKYVSRAVDTLEILKRELNIQEANITTDTVRLTNREGSQTNVSEINIEIKDLKISSGWLEQYYNLHKSELMPKG